MSDAARSPQGAPSTVASPTNAGAQPSLQWVSGDDSIAYLAPETDNVWIELSCPRGSGRIRIDEPTRDRPTSTIMLVSGDIVESYAATMRRADEEPGLPPCAAADTNSGSPLMERFRRTGELKYQGGSAMVVHTEGERRLIEAFFASCG